MKQTYCPLKMYCAPPNLKTWLRAYPARSRNHKPEPVPSPTFIFEAKFTGWVKICATAGY